MNSTASWHPSSSCNPLHHFGDFSHPTGQHRYYCGQVTKKYREQLITRHPITNLQCDQQQHDEPVLKPLERDGVLLHIIIVAEKPCSLLFSTLLAGKKTEVATEVMRCDFRHASPCDAGNNSGGAHRTGRCTPHYSNAPRNRSGISVFANWEEIEGSERAPDAAREDNGQQQSYRVKGPVPRSATRGKPGAHAHCSALLQPVGNVSH